MMQDFSSEVMNLALIVKLQSRLTNVAPRLGTNARGHRQQNPAASSGLCFGCHIEQKTVYRA